jgi:hypothetical protein
MEKNAQAGNALGGATGIAGALKIPKLIADSMGGAAGTSLMTALTGLLGVIPPHMAAQKTEGTYPTDQQWKDWQGYKQTRDDVVNKAWRGVTLGTVDWHTAINDYFTAEAQYRTQSNTLFHNAPQWVNGTKGLLSQYEAIGRDQNGSVDKAFADEVGLPDAGKIKAAQEAFKQQHAHEWPAVQAELTKNTQANPMLKLYFDVQDNYAAKQDQWAHQMGVQPAQLRQHLTAYYQAYNDTRARTALESKYPDIRQYYSIRKNWLTTSWGGLMWGMMHDNAVVNQWLEGQPGGKAQAEQMVTQNVEQSEGVKP